MAHFNENNRPAWLRPMSEVIKGPEVSESDFVGRSITAKASKPVAAATPKLRAKNAVGRTFGKR